MRMLSVRWLAAAGLLLAPLALAAQVDVEAAPIAAEVEVEADAAAQAPPLAPIPFAAADAAGVRTPSAPDAWGGPRDAADVTLSDRVTSYRIRAELDPESHVIHATQVLRWRNRSDRPVETVYLHMYLNAFEGPGSTLMTERRLLASSGRSRGSEVLKDGQWGHITLDSVSQGGADVAQRWVHPDNGPETDHTVLALDLAAPVPAGATLELDMAFTSQLPRVVIRTGWWGDFHLAGQWFPKIGVLELPGERGATEPRWNVHEFHFHSEFYADYGSYDVELTVPEDFVVAATGRATGAPRIAAGKATHHYVQHDVVDFAWMAAPGFAEMTDTWTGAGSPEVAVRVVYPPEYEAVAGPVLQATLDSLDYFSRTLGPYPYETVTAVVPPWNAGEAGGMEYPTFFTASGGTDYTPGTMNEFMLDFVTVHEFGHGYFMGILGSNEFEEPMLDEGLNEYWDQRMLADRGQRIHPLTRGMRRLGLDVSADPFIFERLMGVTAVGDPADPLSANAWDRMSNMSYGSVYARSAATFRTLENLIGADAMARGMKHYYALWKFRHPSTADFQAALAEGSGAPELVHAIFDSQVWGAERIDVSVESVTTREAVPRAGGVLEDGVRSERTAKAVRAEIQAARKQWQKDNPDADAGGPWPWHSAVTLRRLGTPLPVEVRVRFADDNEQRLVWDDDARWKRFEFSTPAKLVSAEVDPDGKLLLDADRSNDSRTVEPDDRAARRYTADWSTLVSAFLSLLVTL